MFVFTKSVKTKVGKRQIWLCQYWPNSHIWIRCRYVRTFLTDTSSFQIMNSLSKWTNQSVPLLLAFLVTSFWFWSPMHHSNFGKLTTLKNSNWGWSSYLAISIAYHVLDYNVIFNRCNASFFGMLMRASITGLSSEGGVYRFLSILPSMNPSHC